MKNLLMLLFLFISSFLTAQQVEDAWVYFLNKPQANTYLSNPLSMLSQRALDRRSRLNISLDEKDVPIDQSYIDQIKNTAGITYKAKSKWLNAVHVQGTQNDISSLLDLSFVDYIEFANKNIGIVTPAVPKYRVTVGSAQTRSNFDYGAGYNQIHMLNGEVMHQQNFTGAGVLLAVIDAGFQDTNTASLFQHLFQDNKIIDVYNFVDNNTDVYQRSMHGSGVLSTIAAKTNGTLVGTAPDVSVALYISEDVNQEMPIEETYWAEAAERADSLGVDVINTSLGYTTFDRSEYNYTLDDLNGVTSFISRAAEIAVSRGINVVVSAGNSGGNPNWPKIGMPGDAEHVITVGAVNANGDRASFSSTGPTADGRIKPDVMAQGEGAAAYWYGSIQNINGTSFSSPITAGMVACMVQAFPNKTPAQIKQDLLQISDRFNNPDNYYGYGIPNFSLYDTTTLDEQYANDFYVYPNPAKNILYTGSNEPFELYGMDGKRIMYGKARQNQINISGLLPGIYYLLFPNKTFKIIVE